MFVSIVRRVPLVVIVVSAALALVFWVLSYEAAGARAATAYSPSLAPAPSAALKLSPADAAPYTVAVLNKRTAAARGRSTGTMVTAPMTEPRAMRRSVATITRTSTSPELARAKALLATQIRKHPILRGTTLEFGNARGYQAICYYRSARIVISRSHTASLDKIIGHEVWHVIDWRDNGRIDWGEKVPPR